jgi:hypothetical protein
MTEPPDHKNPEDSLAAAVEWATADTWTSSGYRLLEIRFGQRNPEHVGPGSHYWYADVRIEVCNSASGIVSQAQTAQDRLRVIIAAWNRYYHPQQGGPDG